MRPGGSGTSRMIESAGDALAAAGLADDGQGFAATNAE